MKLGIVGHAAEKFTQETEQQAREAIRAALVRHAVTVVVSGRSPMGGVDIWAEEEAAAADIATLIFEPKRRSWGAPGGFKERNLQIAHNSDRVLVVVVRKLPPGFRGRFVVETCYHCRDRNPPHVKSGGCWTAWRCPQHEWVIL